MHTRRRFLIGALAPALLATTARANVRCLADPKHGGELCKTFIDIKDAYQETYHARHEPGAIWIACVAVNALLPSPTAPPICAFGCLLDFGGLRSVCSTWL